MTSYHIDISELSSNPDLAALSMLHIAAVNGDKSTLELLLKKSRPEDYKCDVNEGDKYGRPALVYTIFGGWYDCAELLLRNGATVRKEDRDKRTPLHWAAYLGKPKFVSLLLRRMEKNRDWNIGDLDGRTPLHYAAAHRNSKCLRLLLKHIAPRGSLDATDREKKTALHWSVYYGNFEHVKLLREAGAIVNQRDAKCNSFLHLAVANPSPDAVRIVRYLLKINRFFSTQRDIQHRTPLHLAVANENEILVKELSMALESPLDELDGLSRSALHYAVLRNNVQIVNILIARGASIYKVDTSGATPLHYAAKNNNTDVLHCFLSYEKLEDIPDKNGRTALMWAASEGSEKVLELMLKNPRYFDVHTRDNEGLTALHFACIAGHLSCVVRLIGNSADVRQTDNLGQSPLFKACQQGHVNIADFLMNNEMLYLGNLTSTREHSVTIVDEQEYSGNTRDRDEFDQTFEGESHYVSIGDMGNYEAPVAKTEQVGHNAFDQNRKQADPNRLVKNQIEASRRLEIPGKAPSIAEGESNGNLNQESSSAWKTKMSVEGSRLSNTGNECIKCLEDCNGCTPLHFAAHSDHVAACKWLLEKGVDPAKKDSFGRTALHGAAFNGHVTCMALMLSRCPRLRDDRDNDGFCALHRAAVNGHLEAVKLLVSENKAFPNFRVKSSNLTPLDLAMAANQQDVTQFLIDNGGLTIASVQELASNTIKNTIREWIRKRKQTTLKPLLEKHKMLTRERTQSLKNALGTTEESSNEEISSGKQEHLGDMASGSQDKTSEADITTEVLDEKIIEQDPEKKFVDSHGESKPEGAIDFASQDESNNLELSEPALRDVAVTAEECNDKVDSNQVEQQEKQVTREKQEHFSEINSYQEPEQILDNKDQECVEQQSLTNVTFVPQDIMADIQSSKAAPHNCDIEQQLEKQEVKLSKTTGAIFPPASSTEHNLTEYHGDLAVELPTCEGEQFPAVQDITELPYYEDSDQGSLFQACRQSKWDLNDVLANCTEVNYRDENGCTPLHVVAEQGDDMACRRLIDHGADLGKRDVTGQTPLHHSALKGQLECIRLFLERKPDLVNVLDRDNRTALHCAADRGHLEVVKLLMLEYNADPSVTLKSTYLTALDLAILGHHENVQQFMIECGSKTSGLLESSANVIKRNIRRLIRHSGAHSPTQEALGGIEKRSPLNKPDEINCGSFEDKSDSCLDNTAEMSKNQTPSDFCPLQSSVISSVSSEFGGNSPTADFKYLPKPPKEQNPSRTVSKNFAKIYSRAPDHVVAAGEKEKIFRLRHDWERIVMVRRKIKAAVVIQRFFREYSRRKDRKSGHTGSSRNQTTTVEDKSASRILKSSREDRQPTLLKRHASGKMDVRCLRSKSPGFSSSDKERTPREKGKFKSCFPTLSQSTSAASYAQSKSTNCSENQSFGNNNLSSRSCLTTNQLVARWLCKDTAKSERVGYEMIPGRENSCRSQSAKNPRRKASDGCYIRSNSLPERRDDATDTIPYKSAIVRSKTFQNGRQRSHSSDEQGHLSRESLVRGTYASPAAVSYNFALDTYHPMSSRRGCRQPPFPFKTSRRVRPNSMKKGTNGWVHTAKFAKAMQASSESSFNSR